MVPDQVRRCHPLEQDQVPRWFISVHRHQHSRDLSGDELLGLAREDDTVVLGLEPLHGVLLGQAVWEANLANLGSPVSHIHAGPAEDDKEVHTIDTNARVILDSQVNVLLDAEAKVAVVGEVLLPQLVLLNLEAPLQNLLCLRAPDGAVDRNLLIPPDTKATDGVASLGEHRGLTSQRLQHLASPGEPITRLANTDVEAEFSDPQVPHGVLSLVLATFNHFDLSLVEVNQAIKAW